MKCISYVLVRVVWVCSLFFGFVFAVQGLINVGVFLSWYFIVISTLSCAGKIPKIKDSDIGRFHTHKLIVGISSVICIFLLVMHSWFITGTLVLLTMLLHFSAVNQALKLQEGEKSVD